MAARPKTNAKEEGLLESKGVIHVDEEYDIVVRSTYRAWLTYVPPLGAAMESGAEQDTAQGEHRVTWY